MYSTKTATTNNNEFNSSYMPVGINKQVHIKEVNVSKTQNGRNFLEIIFENEEGQTATMTEWKNEKNMWIKTDEDLQRRDDAQFGRILQVMGACADTLKNLSFEGNSFVEMINWVKSEIDRAINNNEGNRMRLKVVYDKNGYTKVSNLGIFVEPMSIDEDKSQIKLWKNDLLERPIVADKEPATDPLAGQDMSDFSTPVTETSGADDLPF